MSSPPATDKWIRWVTNFWTWVVLLFSVLNFLSFDRYHPISAPLYAIYVGLLGFYVTTKEFERWHEYHESRHPGEYYVLGWTMLMGALFLFAFLSGGRFKIETELAATYIAVMGVFAITRQSKYLHARRRR